MNNITTTKIIVTHIITNLVYWVHPVYSVLWWWLCIYYTFNSRDPPAGEIMIFSFCRDGDWDMQKFKLNHFPRIIWWGIEPRSNWFKPRAFLRCHAVPLNITHSFIPPLSCRPLCSPRPWITLISVPDLLAFLMASAWHIPRLSPFTASWLPFLPLKWHSFTLLIHFYPNFFPF